MEAKTQGPVLCSPAPAQQTQRVPSGHADFGRRERPGETCASLAVTSRLPQERRRCLWPCTTPAGHLEGLFLRRRGRRHKSEGKTLKTHESKLKQSLASYESEDGKRALQMALGCFQKGGERFHVTAHLMMRKRALHFLRSENNNFFLLSNLPASPLQERSKLFYQVFI